MRRDRGHVREHEEGAPPVARNAEKVSDAARHLLAAAHAAQLQDGDGRGRHAAVVRPPSEQRGLPRAGADDREQRVVASPEPRDARVGAREDDELGRLWHGIDIGGPWRSGAGGLVGAPEPQQPQPVRGRECAHEVGCGEVLLAKHVLAEVRRGERRLAPAAPPHGRRQALWARELQQLEVEGAYDGTEALSGQREEASRGSSRSPRSVL